MDRPALHTHLFCGLLVAGLAAVVTLVGAVGSVAFYPATGTVTGRLFRPPVIGVALPAAALVVPVGLHLHHASGRYER